MSHGYSSHYVATVKVEVNADIEHVFSTIAPIDLRKIFKGYLFLPAIIDVREYPGHWDKVGLSRRPLFRGGGSARETLTEYRSFSTFSYEIREFTGIFGRIISSARGEWKFKPTDSGGTSIQWTYWFFPHRFWSPVVYYILLPFWKGYMNKALQLACSEVVRLKPAA